LGADILDHIMITDLLVNNGSVSGAVGFNISDGTLYIFRGKTVVMALGNTVARVTTNSTGRPFNCHLYPYDTGSQCILAYDVGAKIFNLDIANAATILPKGFGAPGMNALNSMGGRQLNALDERFMGKYDPHWENCNRAHQVLGTYQEILDEKGPPFYMDMSHFSSEEMALLKNLLVGDKETFDDYLIQLGTDLSKEPMEVELGEISLGGSVLMDNQFESNIKGLFVGCIFGFFSGAMCGGYAAGIEAGKAAVKMNSVNDIDTTQVIKAKEKIFQPMNNEKGIRPKEFEGLIQQVMKYYMGFSRNQKGIETALQKLEIISSHAEDIKANNYHELMRANEARHLLRHCQLSTRAALERKETGRTFYRRSDYPNIDPEFNKRLIMWQENNTLQLSFKPMELTSGQGKSPFNEL
jgi:succinate dehydrogenase/fumarate reductase flavoprotein subunit